ncbi:hypothetical protein ACHAW6_000148 [Cyclotella cf. meneghiniana]
MGYVILAFGCPVLWCPHLHTEIALSTMEAKYIALSMACKDLFPLLDLVCELSATVGLPSDIGPCLHCKVREDNIGALTLGGLQPRHMTPWSKHYAIKYHRFCSLVFDPSHNITIVKINSKINWVICLLRVFHFCSFGMFIDGLIVSHLHQ